MRGSRAATIENACARDSSARSVAAPLNPWEMTNAAAARGWDVNGRRRDAS